MRVQYLDGRSVRQIQDAGARRYPEATSHILMVLSREQDTRKLPLGRNLHRKAPVTQCPNPTATAARCSLNAGNVVVVALQRLDALSGTKVPKLDRKVGRARGCAGGEVRDQRAADDDHTEQRAVGVERDVLDGVRVALERALKLSRLVVPDLCAGAVIQHALACTDNAEPAELCASARGWTGERAAAHVP